MSELDERLPWRHNMDEQPMVWSPRHPALVFRVANLIDAVMACNALNGYALMAWQHGAAEEDPLLELLQALKFDRQAPPS